MELMSSNLGGSNQCCLFLYYSGMYIEKFTVLIFNLKKILILVGYRYLRISLFFFFDTLRVNRPSQNLHSYINYLSINMVLTQIMTWVHKNPLILWYQIWLMSQFWYQSGRFFDTIIDILCIYHGFTYTGPTLEAMSTLPLYWTFFWIRWLDLSVPAWTLE